MTTKKCIKRIVMTSFSLLIMLCLSGCANTKPKMLDASMDSMTSQDFKSLFAEKRTAKWYDPKRMKGATMTYLPDKSVTAVSNGKDYPGTYSIENGKICSKMDHRKGQIRCATWVKVDANKYDVYGKSGSYIGNITFE